MRQIPAHKSIIYLEESSGKEMLLESFKIQMSLDNNGTISLRTEASYHPTFKCSTTLEQQCSDACTYIFLHRSII